MVEEQEMIITLTINIEGITLNNTLLGKKKSRA